MRGKTVFNPVKTVVGLVYGDRRLLALVMLINVAGSAFGLYYYRDQLMMTPWYYWLFVPDCPLYTFFMIFALLFIMMGKRFDTFNTITAVGLAMYGTWTMLVLIYFGEAFFAPENALMSSALWISHLGMALESIFLLPYIKKARIASWLIAGAWLLLQGFMDYFVPFMYNGQAMRLHPLAIMEYYTRGMSSFPVLEAKLDTMMYVTLAMTVIFIALIYILSRNWAFTMKEPVHGAKKSEI
ncbi:DUF1405 domain-containing protein [Methanocella conradii]|uniref:DUF1405 domain-containing protein n=1 Tax=Methanocella conradii TaxID=1175444 RepID=UPI001ED90F0E|nr:DUF1405 domain-containing protein [Methanocella conradii]MDI6897616.1 DUF1405 domain-containing protein [Methanocella conradii]